MTTALTNFALFNLFNKQVYSKTTRRSISTCYRVNMNSLRDWRMRDKEKKLSNSTEKLVLRQPILATIQVVFAEKIFKFQCYKVKERHSKTCCIQSNDFSPVGKGEANPLRFVIEKIFNLPVYGTLYDWTAGKIPVYKCTLYLNLAIRNDYGHSKHVFEYEFREATTDEI